MASAEKGASGVSISPPGWRLALWGVILAYFGLTLALGLSYHWGYLSTLTDVGTFDQAVWATLHGHPFLNTNLFGKPVSYFGIHFRPILALFLPFYAILPRVEWMIVAQSAALSLAAWPIYLLARQVSKSESVAFFWALAYLFNPFVLNTAPWVFRPESLAVPFIAAAFLGLVRQDFRLTLASCLVILLCKEHFGIAVAGIGLLWWIRHRDWQGGAVLAGLGLLYSLVVLTRLMPALSPTGRHVMLSKGMERLSRYAWLGGSVSAVVQKLLLQPLTVAKTVFAMGGGLYLFLLLFFVCGLPLAAPELLLPGLADLLANMLSLNPMPRSVFAYHSVSLVPILVVAALYGSNRLVGRRRKDLLPVMAVAACVLSLVGGYMYGPFPLPGVQTFWAPAKPFSLPDPALAEIQRLVGAKASVSAQANVGAQFSQRERIFCYPEKVGEVDTVVLRLASPTNKIVPDPQFDRQELKFLTGTLDAHLQMNRAEYCSSIDRLLKDRRYGILLWQDPWLVFSRQAKDRTPIPQIRMKLERLRDEWQVR